MIAAALSDIFAGFADGMEYAAVVALIAVLGGTAWGLMARAIGRIGR